MIPDLGALTTINVDAYDTGDDLAKEVSKKINLPTDMFKLVSAGSVIKSEIRLNQQNLKPGMPIKILPYTARPATARFLGPEKHHVVQNRAI